MSAATKAKAQTNGNGTPAAPDPLIEAIAYEEQIAEDAAEIRGDAKELTPELFMELRPLLRKPIPSAFIVTTGKVEGKPYPSTGVKSLQVLTDRMDNVLTPFWWRYDVEYVGPEGIDARGVPNAGRLAEVTVYVGSDHDKPLIVKRSRGGVNQASTIGNLFKGSETNAAKRAFAAIGPAWEVYVGAADFDPDVDPDAAKAQAKTGGEEAAPRKLPAEKVETLQKAITEAGLDPFLEMKLRSFGAAAISDLTVEQGVAIWEWVQSERASG